MTAGIASPEKEGQFAPEKKLSSAFLGVHSVNGIGNDYKKQVGNYHEIDNSVVNSFGFGLISFTF
jgi:hypothetical protein